MKIMPVSSRSLIPLVLALALLLPGRAAAVPAPPNILIILADDCTYSDLPINGGENAKTPNIDAFARQGTIFQRAYLGMAMCSPCR